MKVIISHPTSNQFNRTAVKGLLEEKMLYEFHTAIASFPGSILDKLSNLGPLQEIDRRSFQSELSIYTRTWPWIETGRLLASKANLKTLTKHETGFFCLDAVYQKQDRLIASIIKKKAKKGLDAIYAYEDGAGFSFREAKKNNLTCFYDLPIGYWRTARKLLIKEQQRWPEYLPTLTGLSDSQDKLDRKDEELALADRIFVASTFTARSLNDYPGKLAPIEIIPYGFPKAIESRNYESFSNKRRLKLLFVGGLSQRKGIADVFAAVEKLQPYVSLTVVGQKPINDCAVLNKELAKHTWMPSLSHSKVLSLMRSQDVLLFPSLFEGFGMVITEAMSQGTPVITTDRTSGPDLITHGENGWLIEAGSTENLIEAIKNLLQKPEAIREVGRAALQSAVKRPWEIYGRELARAIEKHSQI